MCNWVRTLSVPQRSRMFELEDIWCALKARARPPRETESTATKAMMVPRTLCAASAMVFLAALAARPLGRWLMSVRRGTLINRHFIWASCLLLTHTTGALVVVGGLAVQISAGDGWCRTCGSSKAGATGECGLVLCLRRMHSQELDLENALPHNELEPISSSSSVRRSRSCKTQLRRWRRDLCPLLCSI